MVSNGFAVDGTVQGYNIYSTIYVCVGNTEADAREHSYNPQKPRDFAPFFEILPISFEIPNISNSRCEKPTISKFLIRNT